MGWGKEVYSGHFGKGGKVETIFIGVQYKGQRHLQLLDCLENTYPYFRLCKELSSLIIIKILLIDNEIKALISQYWVNIFEFVIELAILY